MSLKIGDVVMLKSGGPKMTVAAVKQERAYCVWFNQRDQYHEEKNGEFLIDTLNVLRPKLRPHAADRHPETASSAETAPESQIEDAA